MSFVWSGVAQDSIEGTLSKTLDAFTIAATGTVGTPGIEGTLTVTLNAFTITATAGVEVEGTLTKTLDAFTISATGFVGTPPVSTTGHKAIHVATHESHLEGHSNFRL